MIALPLCAQTLDSLASAYRESPTAQNRGKLARFAAAHPKDSQGARALLALGATDFERKAFAEALPNLKSAQRRLPKLEDYTAYLIASSHYGLKNHSETVQSLEPVWTASPKSPLLANSVLVAARSHLAMQQPMQALDLLRKHLSQLPEAPANLLIGSAAEATGDGAGAVSYYQTVFHNQPDSPEAEQAAAALGRLRESMGENFPPAMPEAMLSRAGKLMNSGKYTLARQEFEAMASALAGAERDLARVRLGALDYRSGGNQSGYSYLQSLRVKAPEADAERLYYVHASARRLEKEKEAVEAVEELEKKYPKSSWLLQALVSAGNQFMLDNRQDRSDRYFRACYRLFPQDPESAYCHWKVTWNGYLRRGPDAERVLRDHLKQYPDSEKAAAALYFLGRNAEKLGAVGQARGYYTEITERLPNYFHAVLARERLEDRVLARAAVPKEIDDFLKSVRPDSSRRKFDFEKTPATQVRIDRARLLASAGFQDWAETELRFGAKTDAQPHLMALELAESAQKRGAPDQALRYIKSLAVGYLGMHFEDAPEKFWRYAFPLPYRKSVEANSRLRSLDPFLVAALIRQESEFNPKAVSRAKAYGLTQVRPATGREISRKLGIRRFRTSMLFSPDVNLKLGTYYLKSLLDQLDGEWEAALASYNAGKSRVVSWLTWADYQEPAEFIETIPFTETRNYVQIVLRNADMYRRLYGAKQTEVTSVGGHNSSGRNRAISSSSN